MPNHLHLGFPCITVVASKLQSIFDLFQFLLGYTTSNGTIMMQKDTQHLGSPRLHGGGRHGVLERGQDGLMSTDEYLTGLLNQGDTTLVAAEISFFGYFCIHILNMQLVNLLNYLRFTMHECMFVQTKEALLVVPADSLLAEQSCFPCADRDSCGPCQRSFRPSLIPTVHTSSKPSTKTVSRQEPLVNPGHWINCFGLFTYLMCSIIVSACFCSSLCIVYSDVTHDMPMLLFTE